MTPSASSRWMRFQHGVDDRPTREPISATERAALSCRTARIFRSIASIEIFFHKIGDMAIYREKYSKSSGRLDGLPGYQCLDLEPIGTARRSADARALDAGNCRAKAHGVGDALALRQRQEKAAVQRIAGAERIDGGNLEHRQVTQHAIVEIDDVVRPVADGKERAGLFGDALEAVAEISHACRRAQALRGKDHVAGEMEQRIVLDGRPVA